MDKVTPEPTATYLYTTDKPNILMLANELGEYFHFPKDAAGDIAMMLVPFETNPGKAEFVGDEWRGRAEVIDEFGPDDDG